MEVCTSTDCRNIAPAGCAEGLCGDHCSGCDVHKGSGKAILEKRRALAEAIRKKREELEKAKAAAPPAPPQWTRYRRRDSAPSEEEELLRAIEESRKSSSLFEGFTYVPPQTQEINITEEQISTIQAILPDFPEEQIVKAFKMQRGDVERTIDFLLTLPTPTTTTTTTTTTTAFSPAPEPIADEEEPEEPQRTSLTAEEYQALQPEEQVKRFLELQKKLELLEQERLELRTTVNKQEREIFYVTGGFSFEVWKNLQKENVLKLQATFEKECVVCLEEKEGLYLTSCGCKVVCRGCYRILKKPRHCPQCNKPIK